MSVINLDEVATLCLPGCLFLSPNLVLNDPFPLFSQPIFYPLDRPQYGRFFMQMAGGRSGDGQRTIRNCLPATICRTILTVTDLCGLIGISITAILFYLTLF